MNFHDIYCDRLNQLGSLEFFHCRRKAIFEERPSLSSCFWNPLYERRRSPEWPEIQKRTIIQQVS